MLSDIDELMESSSESDSDDERRRRVFATIDDTAEEEENSFCRFRMYLPWFQRVPESTNTSAEGFPWKNGTLHGKIIEASPILRSIQCFITSDEIFSNFLPFPSLLTT